MRSSAIAILLFLPSAALAQDATRGQQIYAKRCAQCHGDEGNADGPAAKFMRPRPRKFKDNAAYKFRSTPSGSLPSRKDMFRVITNGIPGTSMPAFPILTAQDKWDLVIFIETFAPEFSDESAIAEAKPYDELSASGPAASAESLARGKEIYTSNKCAQCHGEHGRGNGPSWPDLKDDWKDPILPANLVNKESFRGGAEAADVFRAMTTGLNGTPMPAFRDSLSVEQRWDLSNYVVSLGPAIKVQRDETITAAKVEQIPDDVEAEVWKNAPAARFKTVPNLIEPPRLFWTTVEYVTVQALYTADEVVLRIEWDDRTHSKGSASTRYEDRDTQIYLKTDHADQLAVQFPVKVDPTVRPYFIMGDGKRPVNLWWWRADTGKFLERNAKGPASISDQPERGQTLSAQVRYDDGRYTALIRRSLTTSDDKKDIQFEPGEFVPIAFHIWDGASGEVGNRHALTTWYWLYLAPGTPAHVVWVVPAAFAGTFLLLIGIIRLVRRAEGREVRRAPGSSVAA